MIDLCGETYKLFICLLFLMYPILCFFLGGIKNVSLILIPCGIKVHIDDLQILTY
jgi:hypothetical protein